MHFYKGIQNANKVSGFVIRYVESWWIDTGDPSWGTLRIAIDCGTTGLMYPNFFNTSTALGWKVILLNKGYN